MRLIRASTLGIITAALVATTAGTTSAQSPGTSAAPSPAPSAIPLPGPGALSPGTYNGIMASGFPGTWTVTVPDGWEWFYDFLWKDLDGLADNTKLGGPGEVGLGWVQVEKVFADPCRWKGSLADPVGPTVDDLVSALAAQPGRDPSGATDVTIGGHPATRIELVLEAGLDPAACDEGVYREVLGPGESLVIGQPELYSAVSPAIGQRDVLYVLDLGGSRWLLRTWHDPDASAQDLADLEAIVSSIRIDVPTPASSPAPSPSAAG